MAGTTTAFCTSAKQELMQGIHCITGQVTPTGTSTNSSPTVTGMSSVAGIVVGMPVSGTNIAAGSLVASIDSSSQITLSKNATGANAGLTINGDILALALVKVSPTVTPATSGTTAYTTPSVNPSWTSATISCIGGVLYNQAGRSAGVTNRSLAVLDFGGTQTVSAGTLTVLMPSNTNTTALLRIA